MMAVFEKGVRVRHIGHLDIQRAMMRALRRSGLPVAYSKGFNPHILLTFASALSTGAAGKKEILDVTMAADVDPEAFKAALNRALPPDMQVSSVKVMEDKHPSLMSLLQAAEYEIRILDEGAAKKMAACIPEFLGQESILAMRKTKSGMKETDIRPLIHALRAEGDTLRARVTLTDALACKPDMLLKALSDFVQIEVPSVLVIREGLLGLNEAGELTALETL